MTFSFVDLFAGIGGFHAALSELGGECVLAVEKDEEAARVYADNWGVDAFGDITEIDWQSAASGRSVDVLCAGFPCQPFSKSGAQRGMEETRGTLFFEICKALETLQPKVVMLENVRNLAGPRHKHEWEVIIRSLRELGYRVSSEPVVISPNWLPAEHGGAPQNRERVFILGTYVGVEESSIEVPPTVSVEHKIRDWDLFRDLPTGNGDGDESISDEEKKWLNSWRYVRLAVGDLPTFPLWADWWDASPIDFNSMPGWKQKIILSNQQFYLKNESILKSWKEDCGLNSFPASRRKLEWQAGTAKSADCIAQFRPSGIRIKRANYTGALVAIDQRPVIIREMRRLTIRECARLQGFPEWFSFDVVSERAAFKQLGNAVNVGVVRYVLRTHLEHPDTVEAVGELL